MPQASEKEDRASTRTAEVAPPVILLIEDDPDIRVELRLLLEEEGYAVLEAADARAGIRLAVMRRPAMIIQDLLLPDTPGFELVKELRRLPGGETRPIIALSAFPDRLTEAEVSALGFSTFVRKPPAIEELCEVVRRFLPP